MIKKTSSVVTRFNGAVSLLPHRLNWPIFALCVAIKFYEGVSLLPHRLKIPIFALCVAIKFYEDVSLLPHRLKMPIYALCVAIRFYKGDFLLPHKLDLRLFCYPVRVAILKQLKQTFIGFFKVKMTKGHYQGNSGLALKWWGASNSSFLSYVLGVAIRSSP
jgi:hypothetical protein